MSTIKSSLPELKRTITGASQRGLGSPGAGGWRQWAGEKIKRGNSYDSAVHPEDERISLFPGWATRKYRKASGRDLGDAFDVEVFVSGFASSHRSPNSVTRSQRAFLRLAKGFASLPKLQSEDIPTMTRSTEKLLESVNLPPRPTEITEDYEIETLESQFRAVNDQSSTKSSASSISDAEDSSESSRPSTPPSQPQEPAPSLPAAASDHRHDPPHTSLALDLKRLHANLESRLQPFWSTALPSRMLTISLGAPAQDSLPPDGDTHHQWQALATQDVLTTSDGSFQAHLVVTWESFCHDPSSLRIAFGDPSKDHELLISARLLPPPPPVPPPAVPLPPAVAAKTSILVPITYSPVRLISDIDDTVKLSNILSGARAVFHNVFVKDLRDNVIPGMGPWYMDMWKRGVRFHYVSNGPFELLPVVNEFLQISQLPPGSIRLKSYAGRSLFNGLLSAPATRKRDGVLTILNAFPESRFLLVGDTGEQDLELYAIVASERPDQILGIFVRDAGSWEEGVGAVDDPTGAKWMTIMGPNGKECRKDSTGKTVTSDATINARLAGLAITQGGNRPPTLDPLNPSSEFFTHNSSAPPPPSRTSTGHGSLAAEPGFYLESGSRFSTPPMASESDDAAVLAVRSEQWVKRQGSTDAEKRRAELQVRVWKARSIVPEHIPLRVFRDPDECMEVEDILDKLHVGSSV